MVEPGARSESRKGVLAVVLIYATFASLWILFSDWVLATLFTDPAQFVKASVFKGWGFVLVTALLLYGLLRRLVAGLQAAMQREQKTVNERQLAAEMLRQRNEELEAVMDSLPTPVFIAHDPNCQRITGNQAANNLFRVSAGANVSASADDRARAVNYRVLEAEGGRELDPEELPMQVAARSAQPKSNMECYVCLADGSSRWLLANAIPLFDIRGAVRGAVGVFSDITETKNAQRFLEDQRARLEEAVAARTAELVRVNDQLKAFTYAASHDLKAPLRGIKGFSALLERSCRDRLKEEELSFLDHLQASTARMGSLIDDLLAYAQQEQQALVLRPVPVAEAVCRALGEQEIEIHRRAADVRINLPAATVEADPSAFDQVLRNLIDNALKYAGKADPLLLEIGGEVVNDRCRIWVRDNGIGFDMAYHEKIFEIFCRLQSYNDIPGTGVGLALVKKAVERMGGKVWAESVPGGGATFFLELRIAA